MSKVRKNVTIDKELCELATIKLGMPLSTFINNTLKEALGATDEMQELRKEIYQYETTLYALRAKLCKLQHDEAMKRDHDREYEKCMGTIHRIHEAHGMVGENQIKNVAGYNGIDKDAFLEFCKSKSLNIVNYLEPEKESKMKNGNNINI